MTEDDLRFLAIGIGFVVLGLVLIPVFLRRRKDEIFVGVPPGLVPAPGQKVKVERVSGKRKHYTGPIAVQFTPPEGVGPGLVGTIVDGEAHLHDVTAMIVGLAVRGHLRISEVDTSQRNPNPDQKLGKKDWELVVNPQPPADPLSALEQKLMAELFGVRPVVRLSALTARFAHDMRETQVGLYREVVDRGWYRKHPRKRGCRTKVLAVPIILLGLFLVLGSVVSDTTTTYEPAAPIGFTVLGIILFFLGRGRTPRTALGTAQRIQALGFRQYLATAEAEQIRFEEAAQVFSRYLPYAIVFGLTKEWAKVFQDVVARAERQDFIEDVVFDLTWFDGVYLALEAGNAVVELGTLALDVGELAGSVGDLGDAVGALGDGLSGFAEGVGDFIDAGDVLGGIGDACGDLDGCDLGCIDF